jgi:hypothetical protein
MIFVLFCVVSGVFGPLGLDVPGTRIRGVFFSEWKFINFILYDAIFLSFVAGILRRYAEHPRGKPRHAQHDLRGRVVKVLVGRVARDG